MNNNDKIIEFIQEQIKEINSLTLKALSTEALCYYLGAAKAFECIIAYIKEKKHLGTISPDCILQSFEKLQEEL